MPWPGSPYKDPLKRPLFGFVPPDPNAPSGSTLPPVPPTPGAPVPPGSDPSKNPYFAMLDMQARQAPFGAKERSLDRQMKMADELRNAATPQGRQVGNVYRAANPLEMLNTGIRQVYGQQQFNKGQQAYEDIDKARMGAMEDWRKKFLGQASTNTRATDPVGGGYGSDY